jgi:Cd2+/Zn2+-exporting ATPase
LSYFSGIGRCARFGILVKGSTCLDEFAKANQAAFDKTGTLTEGSFAVKTYSNDKALALAACAEKFSSHPIAAAFGEIATTYTAENAEEIAGRGVKCTVDGKTLICGNAKMLNENGIAFDEIDSLSTVVYVALDGEYVGVIEIDDKIKDGAAQAIKDLKAQGVINTVMLTGDSPKRAESVAKEVGLSGFKAGLLPDEKLDEATNLMKDGGLIYVGDGINDAPVMVAANCAVSMGKVGSDAAIEASDIVLVSDNLQLLPKGKKIARKTRTIVFENIVGSLAVKFAIMAMAVAIPSFPMIVAIFGDVGVMLLAVLNAMRAKLVK